MKVKDLIEKLKAFDPEMLVVTRGLDEEGFADIYNLEIVSVQERTSEAAKQALGEYKKAGDDADSTRLAAVLVDHD